MNILMWFNSKCYIVIVINKLLKTLNNSGYSIKYFKCIFNVKVEFDLYIGALYCTAG